MALSAKHEFFQGERKKGSFCKSKSEGWRKGFLLFSPTGNMEQASYSGFFAQVSVEGCCSLQAPCLGLVSNLAKLFAWETYPIPMSGLVGKAAPQDPPWVVMVLPSWPKAGEGKLGLGGPAAAPASASGNFPIREASLLSI